MRRSFAIVALGSMLAAPVVAQDKEPDKQRIAEIMAHVEARADSEANEFYNEGDYPKAIQNQRVRFEINPKNEKLASDYVWMLGNVEYDSERLAVAIRFKLSNPESPDRGLLEAQSYWEWKMYARIPDALEPDVARQPAPHRNVFTLLSNSYQRMGFDRDVVRVLDLALKAYPDDPVYVRNRARALERIGG